MAIFGFVYFVTIGVDEYYLLLQIFKYSTSGEVWQNMLEE